MSLLLAAHLCIILPKNGEDEETASQNSAKPHDKQGGSPHVTG